MIRLLKGYESSLSWPVYKNYVTAFYFYTQSLAITTSQSYTGDTMASLNKLEWNSSYESSPKEYENTSYCILILSVP